MQWIHNTGIPFSEPLTCSRIDAAFHSFEVNNMNANSGWENVVKVLKVGESLP